MYPTSSDFKKASVSNFSDPFFTVNLYKDEFYWYGAKFGTGIDGTQAGFSFYDYQQKNNFCEIGTSWSGSMTVTGTRLNVLKTGTGTYVGTWVSSIVTPFYKASWDSIYFEDYQTELLGRKDVLLYEPFNSVDSVLKNGWMLNGSVNIDANGFTVIEPSGTMVTSYAQKSVINNGSFFQEGAVYFIAQKKKRSLHDDIRPLVTCCYGTSTKYNSIMIRYYGYALLGQIGTFVVFDNLALGTTVSPCYVSWWKSGTNTVLFARGGGTSRIGTVAFNMLGTSLLVSLHKNEYLMGWNENDVDTSIDSLYLFGSRGTSTFSENVSMGTHKYEMRVSDDAYNWGSWLDVTGSFDPVSKLKMSKLTNVSGNYAQVKTTLNATTGVVNKGDAFVTGIKLKCSYKFENDILDTSAIENSIEQDLNIGRTTTNKFSCNVNNITGKFIGQERKYGDLK